MNAAKTPGNPLTRPNTAGQHAQTPKKSNRQKFRVGAIAYHRAMIDGKATDPLEVQIIERDDEGTPRNCRIAYKQKEIEVGKQMHRLIGGWVSDTTLEAKEDESTVW